MKRRIFQTNNFLGGILENKKIIPNTIKNMMNLNK